MAVGDFNGGGGKNIKVEIVYAGHQNKADVGSTIARKWLEVDGVDAIVDVPNTAIGLTINSPLRDIRVTFLASSTASSDLTGKASSPNAIQWVSDARATGYATAAAMMGRGGNSWYFLTVNFAFGHGIEAEATKYIGNRGGKVLGSSKHPLKTSDFASLLLQAQVRSYGYQIGRGAVGDYQANTDPVRYPRRSTARSIRWHGYHRVFSAAIFDETEPHVRTPAKIAIDFLECRAPCAAVRSLVVNGKSLPPDPPTAAPPA